MSAVVGVAARVACSAAATRAVEVNGRASVVRARFWPIRVGKLRRNTCNPQNLPQKKSALKERNLVLARSIFFVNAVRAPHPGQASLVRRMGG